MTVSARATDALVGDLAAADFRVRARALAELVQRGREATQPLLDALDSSDAAVRVAATRALSAIADPRGADAFADLLEDQDERIRAYAAQGLARLRDPRALDALLRTIDDFPDMLRPPFTPSVDELIALGPEVLPKVVALLDAEDEARRVRAFLIIREILSARPEVGEWDALWRQLGSYAPTAPAPDRERAAAQWRDWIDNHLW